VVKIPDSYWAFLKAEAERLGKERMGWRPTISDVVRTLIAERMTRRSITKATDVPAVDRDGADGRSR
jgi:hypothetical protein